MRRSSAVQFAIPRRLALNCRQTPERAAWLEGLPELLCALESRWSMRLGEPFDGEDGSCAWVAPALLADGTSAVLKAGMPHLEGEHELAGLRFWNGDPTARVLRGDEQRGVMLLERCVPGTPLRRLPEPEQDAFIAGLLRRLWRVPVAPHAFRPLADLLRHWSSEVLEAQDRWADAGLVRDGLQLFEELPRTAKQSVLLAADLHAGNVLRAEREPWLVIDPKPFMGDPAYDVTQHLINCERLHTGPLELIRRIADLLELDRERVRLWMFARAAAGPRGDWRDREWLQIARALAK